MNLSLNKKLGLAETLRPCMKNEDGDLLLFADGMKASHSLGLVSISHRDFLGILQPRHQTVAANHR